MVQFDLRNTLLKLGPFLLGHSVYNMLHKITQKHLAYCTEIFETELFQSVMVQKRQHLDVLGCHIAFSGLIFDSVQI